MSGGVSQEVVTRQFKTCKLIISAVKKGDIDAVKENLTSLPSGEEFQIEAVPTMLNEAVNHALKKKALDISRILLEDERVNVFKDPIFGFCLFVECCRLGWSEMISIMLERENVLDQKQVRKGLELSLRNNQVHSLGCLLKDGRIRLDEEIIESIKKMESFDENLGKILEERSKETNEK